ncbi:hypothetical protein LWC08_05795 [Desulfobaculum bizertense]|uniref:hypothetical protein n=1 Tax=Desulfobaculum bizertense TaxID=376490 RepID=UPI001F3A3431|nr:hypothetical protein [Desulfobaculum bizertense]UIJ39082.1 hypothetical protein LWC08_05795 [Desulfobaculum bizertense]
MLRVELSGYINDIVITALPARFIHRIYSHCLGKHSTPYAANTCFKGILYFDNTFASHFAEEAGFDWNGWRNTHQLYRQQGFSTKTSLSLKLLEGNEPVRELHLENCDCSIQPFPTEQLLADTDKNSVLVLMGAVNKACQTLSIEGISAQDLPQKLDLSIDSFEGFGFGETLLKDITCCGQHFENLSGESQEQKMIDPCFLSSLGLQFDLADLPPLDCSCRVHDHAR